MTAAEISGPMPSPGIKVTVCTALLKLLVTCFWFLKAPSSRETAGIHAAAAMARPALLRPRNVRSHRRTGTGAERPRATAPPPGGGRRRTSRAADGPAPRCVTGSALPCSVPAPSGGLRQRSGPGSEERHAQSSPRAAGARVTVGVRVTAAVARGRGTGL